MKIYEPHGVLAEAYGFSGRGTLSEKQTFLTHLCDSETWEPLCRRVKADSICDEVLAEANCRRCLERAAGLGLGADGTPVIKMAGKDLDTIVMSAYAKK